MKKNNATPQAPKSKPRSFQFSIASRTTVKADRAAALGCSSCGGCKVERKMVQAPSRA